MIRWIAIAALGGLLAALLPAGRALPARPRLSPKEGRALLSRLTARAGLPAAWRVFLDAKAMRESNYNPRSRNDRPGEVRAAWTAYKRNKKRYAWCGWSLDRYARPGSGGWLGIIPSNGLAVFWGTVMQCVDPRVILEPAANLVMGLGYARGLMRWKGFQRNPTWHNLWKGWGNPSGMGPGARSDQFLEVLDRLGHPRSFADRQVPKLPGFDPVALLIDLRKEARST